MTYFATPIEVIEPSALFETLGGDRPPVLIQVTSGDVFASAHIAGARWIAPQELVSGIPPASGRLPTLPQLVAVFSRIGYEPDADIVVYDDEGGGWAGRLGWTLDVIGHGRWRYLNGGLHAWLEQGLPLESGMPEPVEPTQPNLSIDTDPIAEIADVLAAIDDADQRVWDVRSVEEYLGLKQVAARSGHIPGAVNYDWLRLQQGPATRLSEDSHAELAELGLPGATQIITHCQTHHRSGLSYMWGRIQGWPIKAYHGSWSEWGNRDDTPIENPNG